MRFRLVLLGPMVAALSLPLAGCAGCETKNESSADASANVNTANVGMSEGGPPPGITDPIGQRMRPRFFMHRDASRPHPAASGSASPPASAAPAE